MSLGVNDMVEVEANGMKRIYRVQLLDGSNQTIWLRDHRAATLSDKAERLIKTANSLKARKITIDPVGRIGKAND
jgi:hypothetical protein